MPIHLLQVPEKVTVVAYEMSFYEITSVDIDLCLDCSLQIGCVNFSPENRSRRYQKIWKNVPGTA